MTQSEATTPGQSGPRSNDDVGVLRIPQSSSIARVLPSDCLVLYPGHSLGKDLTPLQEAIDWANKERKKLMKKYWNEEIKTCKKKKILR